MSVGVPLLTMSDHCPIRINLGVKMNPDIDICEDYDFTDSPSKIHWNKDTSIRFENILQSPEFSSQFANFLSTDIGTSQSEINNATKELTSLLISGALLADQNKKLSYNKKATKKAGSRRKSNKCVAHPKWHDISCHEAHSKVKATARIVKQNPKKLFLISKLRTETKQYNQLVKSKHKQFVENMFTELHSMQHNNPKGYMELIRSMRDGNFDKPTPDDTSGVSPSEWYSHFNDLLAQKLDPNLKQNLNDLIQDNAELFKSKLDDPFSVEEFDLALKNLKNNKASSFDMLTNEILKVSGKIYKNAFLQLFNAIARASLYPESWKMDILHPIHKANEKDDPNNFRGISIASCFGKLFMKLMKNRLQKFLDDNNLVSKNQGSGKKGTRTSDHLMVIRFLIDKMVKGEKKKLYVCFVDVKKAFDFTNREILIYKLMTEYGIGGNFLKLLQALYDDHKVYVRVSDGLLQPISTTIGLKQGCGISPLLFNLFIDDITKIFDKTCDPVQLGGEDLSCLLWADDLVLLSESPEGLQNSINKTQKFYSDIGLQMNTKKTKVMVFNQRGLKLTKNRFFAGTTELDVVDEYQYLGIKFKPSGSFHFAVGELFDKANRAWFSISNVLYQHKKMAVKRALLLFDSLVRPIFLYAAEFWLPFIITKKGFENIDNLLKFWESFRPETINQKVCRMLLSVHKKCSRLAVLGELGRYPVFVPALKLCLKYQYQLSYSDKDSLIAKALSEMKINKHIDSWYGKVEGLKSLLKLPTLYGKADKVGFIIEKRIKSKFDRFFLDEISVVKKGTDGMDHNKLRLYKTIKGTFRQEPYITNILNRKQRAW